MQAPSDNRRALWMAVAGALMIGAFMLGSTVSRSTITSAPAQRGPAPQARQVDPAADAEAYRTYQVVSSKIDIWHQLPAAEKRQLAARINGLPTGKQTDAMPGECQKLAILLQLVHSHLVAADSAASGQRQDIDAQELFMMTRSGMLVGESAALCSAQIAGGGS